MSIKGKSQELFIGKSGINIITFMGNTVSIEYSEMKRIDYCYASTIRSGYMNFVLKSDKVQNFVFAVSANELIGRTVTFIKEHAPTLNIEEHFLDEKSKTLSVTINAVFGYNELGLSPFIKINQNPNGNIYFNKNAASYYSIIDYTWNGAKYDTITTGTTKTNSNSNTVKRGKALKIGTGAVLGSFINPITGVLVGAAMGAGSKGKNHTKGESISTSTQQSKDIEKDTLATLSFRSLDSGKIYKLSFKCNTELDSKIKCLNIAQNKEAVVNDISQSLEGLKALKELVDMGVITPEEFNRKKAQLLEL